MNTFGNSWTVSSGDRGLMNWAGAHDVGQSFAVPRCKFRLAPKQPLRARPRLVQVLMVAPTAFVFNEQTAADNTFMHASGKSGSNSNVAVI